jgi:Cu/Zn superoxide dismutase
VDLTAKHAKLNANLVKGQNVRCFVDTSLNVQSILGKSLAIKSNDGAILSCGTIRQVMKRDTVTRFSRDGVKGYIKFSQESMYDPTIIEVNVTGLKNLAGGYHVHSWPVPQKLGKTETVCDGSHVAGHFNPNNIVAANSPSAGTGTPDQYEIGDISGKFGLLTGKSELITTYMDYNLPLYGSNSVIGRSIVIHKQAGGARWVCANIESTDEMRIAEITFTYPYIGYMVFQQSLQNWYHAETQIYMELDMVAQTGKSSAHKWHVHTNMVGTDSLVATGRCLSAAGHFNPYEVDLKGNYATQCNPSNPLRCEVGDVANKHGKIDIGTTSEGKQRYFFTDVDLPLSGPMSIIGKSVVIHGANGGGERVSCANIYELPKRVVKVSEWRQMASSNVNGYVKVTENSAGCLNGISETEINVKNLGSQASGLHVHEYPVPKDGDSPCSPGNVGGHFNPFGVDVNTSPANGAGSDDQYEVGDLSGRYGSPCDGKNNVDMTDMDTNVPLRGPLSIVGRSIVIHKTDASRWLCGTIVEDTSVTKGEMYMAKAAFSEGDIQGTITLVSIQSMVLLHCCFDWIFFFFFFFFFFVCLFCFGFG